MGRHHVEAERHLPKTTVFESEADEASWRRVTRKNLVARSGLILRRKTRPETSGLAYTLRINRQKAGLTRAEMARMAEVSSPYLEKLERGERLNPTLQVAVSVCQAYGLTFNDFVMGWLMDQSLQRKTARLLKQQEQADDAS